MAPELDRNKCPACQVPLNRTISKDQLNPQHRCYIFHRSQDGRDRGVSQVFYDLLEEKFEEWAADGLYVKMVGERISVADFVDTLPPELFGEPPKRDISKLTKQQRRRLAKLDEELGGAP